MNTSQPADAFTPAPGQAGFFLSPTGMPLLIDQLLFNTATSRVMGPTDDGGSYVTVNDGIGVVAFRVPEPASFVVLGVAMISLGLVRRRRDIGAI